MVFELLGFGVVAQIILNMHLEKRWLILPISQKSLLQSQMISKAASGYL